MAERLLSLPETVSATPIYRQMEKLEERRKEAQENLTKLQSSGFIKDEPAQFQDFQRFLKALAEWLRKDDNPKVRQKLIRFLVHKITIIPDGFEAHFRVGESYVKIFLIKLESGKAQAKMINLGATGRFETTSTQPPLGRTDASQFLGLDSSNTCHIGAPGRT